MSGVRQNHSKKKGSTREVKVCHDRKLLLDDQVPDDSKHAIHSLYEVTSARGLTFKERLRSLLKLGCQQFSLPIGMLTQVQGDSLFVKVAFGEKRNSLEGLSIPLSQTLCQRTLETNESQGYEDVEEILWNAHIWAAENKVRAYLGTPVHVRGELFGTFCFFGFTAFSNPFTRTEKDFLQLMAQWIECELERRQDQKAIQEMNVALTHAMPGISRLNPKGSYVYVNQNYATMLGYDPSELVGNSWQVSVHPDDLSRAKSAYKKMLREGSGEFEGRAIRKDGSVLFKQVLMVKRINTKGIYMGHHCFMRDITERKIPENQLRESEKKLQDILDNTTAVIYVKDFEGRYLHINQTFEKLFNLDRRTVKGQTDFDIFPKAIAKAFVENDQIVINSHNHLEREEVAPQNGRLHTYISNKFLLRNAQGLPYAVCGISTDITQRKQAEELSRKNQQRWQAIYDQAPTGIAIIDSLTGQFKEINKRYCDIVGYSRDEMLALTFQHITFPDDLKPDLDNMQQLLLGETSSFQMQKRYIRKDGEIIWVSLTVSHFGCSLRTPRSILLS